VSRSSTCEACGREHRVELPSCSGVCRRRLCPSHLRGRDDAGRHVCVDCIRPRPLSQLGQAALTSALTAAALPRDATTPETRGPRLAESGRAVAEEPS